MIARQPLQENRHRGVYVNPISNQAEGDVIPLAGGSDWSGIAVMQPLHRIEAVGQHRYAPVKGFIGRGCIRCAVTKGYANAQATKVFDHGRGSIEFWSERDQCNLVFKAADACLEFGNGWAGEVLSRMGSPSCIGKKRAF